MTDREKAIVMAYTGVAMLAGDKLGTFYEYVSDKLGRPMYTHEFIEYDEIIKKLAKDDFLSLCSGTSYPKPELGKRMADRGQVIEEFEYLLNAEKGNYQDFVDLTVDGGEEILTMLKEQEVRELTMDEWREWKNNPKRNPICELWEHDTSPMWVLNPNDIHEPALLMGKLKLFTGKPTFEQCKEMKWDD